MGSAEGRDGIVLTLPELFDLFWRNYVGLAPDAGRIYSLLRERGETVAHDHVAIRTFDLPPISLDSLARPFEALGYRAVHDHDFAGKRLRSRSFEHADAARPRVLISELQTHHFPEGVREIVRGLAAQVPTGREGSALLFTEAPAWAPVPLPVYRRLLAESEYAAWLSAFGIRVHHFSLSWNALRTFASLPELNDWLAASGFPLDESGGRTKGSPALLIELSSTLPNRVEWIFADGQRETIPSCFLECVRRYPDPATGRLYDGFVAKSAGTAAGSTGAEAGR
jgi:hypothetical protein